MYSVSSPTPGNNGQLKIDLKSPNDEQSAEIYLFGGTVTSWKVKGEEQLFVSENALFNGKKAIRGGIPLVFPQFGQPVKTMSQHGFARSSMWELKNGTADSSGASISLSLLDSPETMELWPSHFALIYVVTLSEKGLETEFNIINTDNKPFDCQCLLHTYIKVPKVQDLSVKGFKGMNYIDQLKGRNTFVEDREAATINEEVDRIYTPSTSTCDKTVDFPVYVAKDTSEGNEQSLFCVRSNGKSYSPITQETWDKSMNPSDVWLKYLQKQKKDISTPSPIETDCVFWNAWIDKAKAMSDMGDLEYLKYVCVEPGLVAKWHTVEPGATLVLKQMLSQENQMAARFWDKVTKLV